MEDDSSEEELFEPSDKVNNIHSRIEILDQYIYIALARMMRCLMWGPMNCCTRWPILYIALLIIPNRAFTLCFEIECSD